MNEERIQKRVSCDYPPCPHSAEKNGAFEFFMVMGGVNPQTGQASMIPPPDLNMPDWVKNLRAVLVDDGSPIGKRLFYCSGQCESKAALDGMHDPHKKVDLSAGNDQNLNAAIEGAKKVAQMKGPIPHARPARR